MLSLKPAFRPPPIQMQPLSPAGQNPHVQQALFSGLISKRVETPVIIAVTLKPQLHKIIPQHSIPLTRKNSNLTYPSSWAVGDNGR